MQEPEMIKLIGTDKLKSKIEALTNADLSKVSYPKILNELLSIGGIPLTLMKIPAGTLISRARLNKSENLFWSEEEISYRNDFMNITEYGRANLPYHSVFYGSLPYPTSDFLSVTPIYELKLNEILPPDFSKGKVTIGFWEVVKPFQVWNIVFDDNLSMKHDRIREDIESYLEIYEKAFPDRIEDLIYLLKFITGEFLKQTKSHHDYKISATYSEYCMNMNKGISGIIYPSLCTEHNGINIALFHKYFDINLRLKHVDLMEIEKTSDTSFTIVDTLISTEFGNLNTDFKYKKVEHGDKHNRL
jgi:hypothetical protein